MEKISITQPNKNVPSLMTQDGKIYVVGQEDFEY
jgi:hypothetical protein